MKTKLFYFLSIYLKTTIFFLLPLTVIAQNFPNPEQNIFVNLGNSSVVESHLSDLDGDGYLDAIFSYGTNSNNGFIWLKNTDGLGNYSTPQNIVVTSIWMTDIHTADIDDDGDMDIITASSNSGDVYWFENLDGLGTFSSFNIIAPNEYGASSVFTADIDNDGDLDVLSASFLSNRISWYENTDGLGTFGSQQVIITSQNYMTDVYAADMDGDGDIDVLSASKNDDRIAWYENDGLGAFGPQQTITTNADEAILVYAADIDGDGDNDVISGSYADNRIAWYENDGLGAFGAQQTIYTNSTGLRDLNLTDLDGDGDLDIVSAYSYTTSTPHEILWHENKINCTGNFAPQQIIDSSAFAAWKVSTGDIDGDGDMDVLGSYTSSIRIAWYENITSSLPQTNLPEEIYICNENFEELCGPPSLGCNLIYNWYYNNPNGTSFLVSNNQCYTPDQYGTYTLITENENNIFSNYTVSILNPISQPSLGSNGEICIGEIISINGQGFDNGNYEITWYHNGQEIQVGGETLMTSFASGTITVKISYIGCKGIVTESVEVVKCCPDNIPVLGIDGEICVGEIISINGQGFDSINYEITWLHNGIIVQQGGTTLTTSYNSGMITVQVSYKGCKERISTNVTLKECCNKKECIDKSSINISPNPTKDKIIVKLNERSSGKIQVLDRAGNIVIETTVKQTLTKQVDLSKLRPGLYVVNIILKDKIITKKIIKE
ncbi:FG-GAP repeat domain-containing protein [Tenacibaculum ovolyticum]|uniref:FG-GAP repeat domain-containing protein n=1 Tax=Tenacibaculum ovolyticum TaxID=104270 RepID=UPI0003FAE52B|nr:VCBS repeat-containing protein [Tenacibaculum ovolyticum]